MRPDPTGPGSPRDATGHAAPDEATAAAAPGAGPSPDPRPASPGRRRLVRLAQLLLLAVVLAFAVRTLAGQRDALADAAGAMRLDAGWIALASGLVLATYAMLVGAWTWLIRGFGGRLPYGHAVRIWTVSNLGRYLPGKVWSVGALAVLAREQGVAPVTAAGAALLGTVLNLGAGLGLLAVSGSTALDAINPWFRPVAIAGTVAFAAGLLALPSVAPRLVAWWSRRRGLTEASAATPPLPAATLWGTVGLNLLAWVGYGVAFACFARGTVPAVSGALPAFIAVYTAAYLAGYVVLLAPGGIGVREVAITAALAALGMASVPEATVLALASRFWLTLLEIVPGLVGLAFAPAARRAGSRGAP